jgi:hypothetical protein
MKYGAGSGMGRLEKAKKAKKRASGKRKKKPAKSKGY